ncbi:MAG TPA: 50S ribosomal protein L29 [Anaeromyxobacteraceae bacterium]|nr:50S ribosomal protein L29 [Anaeromyxobacteraceae bacterium]
MSTANELRQLRAEELQGRVAELKQQLFGLKSKHSTGVVDSTAELGATRRLIARCLTVKRELELGLKRLAKETAKPAAKGEKAEKAAKKAEKPAKKATHKE